jgi:hypothetical protein
MRLGGTFELRLIVAAKIVAAKIVADAIGRTQASPDIDLQSEAFQLLGKYGRGF